MQALTLNLRLLVFSETSYMLRSIKRVSFKWLWSSGQYGGRLFTYPNKIIIGQL